MAPATASLPSSAPNALSLTDDEIARITAVAAHLPGRWTVATEHTDNGRGFAGLIATEADATAFAFTIERHADGLGVARANGAIVAKGCASIGETMAAIRRAIRQ